MPERETADVHIERCIITVAVVGSGVVFWRGANDIFGTPKQLVVLLGALGVIALAIYRLLRGELRLVRSPATVALGAFLVLGLIAAVRAEANGHAFFGQHGRGSGYLLYLATSVLFLGAVRSFTQRAIEHFLVVFLGAVLIVAVYALIQHTGHDPLTWAEAYGPRAAFSTLGNTNFASGYLALGLPVAAWLVLAGATWAPRIVGAVVGAVVVVALVATGSSQGLVAAAAGVGVVALARVGESGRHVRSMLLTGMGIAAAVGLLLLCLGLAGRGPLDRLKDGGYEHRRDYWAASWTMLREHPLGGVGFDMWAGYFREARSAASAQQGLGTTTDEPHSVPLSMLTSGGVPLGLAYAAFVLFTGWAAVVGLVRLRGQLRLVLATVAGMWVAYQVQSLVSLDIPPFPAAHFVLAGLVFVASGSARWWVWRPPLLVPTWVAAVLAAVVVLPFATQALRPFRAERAVQRAADAARAGDAQAMLTRLNEATHLAGWEPSYWSSAADLFNRSKRYSVGLLLYERAIEADRRSFAATLNAARTAKAAHRTPEALHWYRRALELEPNAPELRAEVADYYFDRGLYAAARKVLQPALVHTGAAADAWRALGDLRRHDGDLAGARRAYETSERLDPGGTGHKRLTELSVSAP